MLLDFLLQLTSRFVKLLFSYVSWQSHETFINSTLSLVLTFMLVLLLLSVFL